MADYPDFEGAKSKLFTVADWAAVEATDKNFVSGSVASGYSFGNGPSLTYVVPTGKTLFIIGIASVTAAKTDTDYDHFLYTHVVLWSNSTILAKTGGIGGGALSLLKPIAFDAGETMKISGINWSNITCLVDALAWGYEI